MIAMMKDKAASFGLIFIAVVTLAAIFAPAVSRHDPAFTDSLAVMAPPSKTHIFGTDLLGRDLFSRIVYGGRISLSVGFIAVGIALAIGLFFGSVAGYCGGRVDGVIMRLVDVMLCFPTFFLILAVIAVIGPSIFTIMAVIGSTSWMGVARLVRAEILSLKEREFVAASKVMGGSRYWIITRHLMPNAIGPVIVNAALGVGAAILTESALSFLGIGVQPPTPSWGNILIDGKSTIGVAWWLTLFPGLFIFFTVLSYNILGEKLRVYFCGGE